MAEGMKRARAAARATREQAAPKKVTFEKADALIAAMVELQECEDCPNALRIAFDDARAAISPWYDGEEG